MIISRLGGGGGGSSEGAKFYIKVDVKNVSIATLYAKKEDKIFSESYTGSTAQIEVDDFGTYAVYAVVNGEKTDEISVDVTTQCTAVQTITVPLPTAVNDLTVEASENVSDPTKADFKGTFTKPSDVTKVRVYLGDSASVSDTDYIRSTDCSEAESFIFGGYQKDKAYYFVIYTENKFGIKAKGNVVSAKFSEGGFAQWVASRPSTASVTSFENLTEVQMRELMTVHASQDILVAWLTNTPTDFAQFASSRIAMKWIGLRDRIFDKLIAIPSVKSQILASTYCYTYCLFQSVDGIPIKEIQGATSGYGRLLNESVPVMTSNNLPLGEVIESGHYSGSGYDYSGFRAFSADLWGWTAQNDGSFGKVFIGYIFTKKINLKKVGLYLYDTQHRTIPFTWRVDGLVNGSTWEEITTVTTTKSTDNYEYFDVKTSKIYTGFRFVPLSTSSSYPLTVGSGWKIKIYGVSYSEEEFGSDGIEMLYDNGVNIGGVSAMGTYTGRANGTTQSLDDYFYSKSTGAYMPSIGVRIDNTTGKYKAVISEYKEKTLSSNTVYLASATVNNGGWNPNVESYVDIISGKNSGQVARGRNVTNIANTKLNNYLFSAPYTESSNNECKTTKLWLLKA